MRDSVDKAKAWDAIAAKNDEIERLRKSLSKMQAAMIKYEVGVEGDKPSHHIEMMEEVNDLLSGKY